MPYFDHFATGTSTGLGDWLTMRAIGLQCRYLARYTRPEGSPDLLEIGPGLGEFATALMAAGYRNYDVVEPNAMLRSRLQAAGVRHAKSYLAPRLQEADASYDAIIACDVFEHLNDAAEAQMFIEEAMRVLRPAGILFILSPDFLDWEDDFYNADFSHSNPTTVRRTREMFQNTGFETAGFAYSYTGFQGLLGFLLNRVVKAATFGATGDRLESKLYKLRLTFLRRFMIVGRKPPAA